jgi:hypothetical protein
VSAAERIAVKGSDTTMFNRNSMLVTKINIYKPTPGKLKEIDLYIMAASFLPIS